MDEDDAEPHLRDADLLDNRPSKWRWSLCERIADWFSD